MSETPILTWAPTKKAVVAKGSKNLHRESFLAKDRRRKVMNDGIVKAEIWRLFPLFLFGEMVKHSELKEPFIG